MFIVTKKIDSENISKVCRTCLREDNDKMVCLFIGPAESSLGAKLQSLSCLKVLQGDGLPEKMCDRCVTRAESALLFREQCRAADQALRQAALQVSRDKAHSDLTSSAMPERSESFLPLQYSQNASTFADCKLLGSQDYYVHPMFYQRNEPPSRHMHIVEPQNTYLDLSRSSGPLNHDLQPNKAFTVLRPNNLETFARHEPTYYGASCALQCSLCNYTFMNSTQLANHSITHNSDNMDLSNDDVHIEVEENSNPADRNMPYERPISQSIENPMENITMHKDNPNCSNSFENLSFTNGNPEIYPPAASEAPTVVEHSISEIVKNNKFKCETCCELFSQKSKLTAHQMSHSRKKPFECNHCGKTYSSKSKLSAHTRLHTQLNVHQCKICQKIFSYPSYLTEHMKIHTDKEEGKNLSFECSRCNKKFQFAKSYKRHMKFHTGKGLFHCDICDKLFTQKYSLKVHIRSHQPERLHKCDICDKSFNQKSNIVEHMRIHTKVKPFKCKICDKSFAQSSHLKSHEVSHGSVRQHQCRVCGKRFKLASHLKRHVNLHTGLKKYKCEECDQMFSQAFSLKRHSKKHSEAS